MRFRMIVRFVGILSAVLMCSVRFVAPAHAATNVLTNPGAELNGTGWTTITNGGDGMSYDFDGLVRSGSKSFQTSYGLDSISQTVDLFAHGYSANSLSTGASITFSVWVASRGDQSIRYYAKFSLLQQDGTTVVTSTHFGSSDALISADAGTDWTELTYTFTGFGSGVRYAYIEFGGQDQSVWAGHYGAHFDDASVTVPFISSQQSVEAGGGNPMPSWGFLPPKGPFSISLHDGTATVHGTNVQLDLSASDDVDRMALSRRSDFEGSGIVPFSTSQAWSICGGAVCEPGTYDVYAKFYQAYGLSSPVQHIAIMYAPVDVAAPTSTLHTESALRSTRKIEAPLFTRNLHVGDRGEDVQRLQIFFNMHGYVLTPEGVGSPGRETDVFGPMLRSALIHFQEMNATKLLAPLGMQKGTGFFGTRTRAFINEVLRQDQTKEGG